MPRRLALLGLFVLLVLPGCRERSAPGQPSVRPDVAKETIDFWHIQTYEPTKPAVEQAVARAEAARPGLEVRAEAIKNDPFKTKLATAMGAGAPPDIFHSWGGGILAEYAANGRVMDLTDATADIVPNLHPAALDFCRFNGRLHALPVDVSVVPMWYNKSLFAKAGVEPPTTLDEFMDVCAKLRVQGITPVALGNAQSWPGAFYFVYYATRYGGGEALAKRRYDDKCFVEAGEAVQRLVGANVFSAGFNGLGYDDARRLFFNGEAAMILMGTWIVAHARSEAPDLLPNLDCFPFPAAGRDPSLDTVVVGGVNAAYAISASTRHTDACLHLIRHLTDDVAMKEWAATGRIPALSSDHAATVLGDDVGYARILYGASRIQLYYDQLLPPALATMHKETTQALFAGTMTPRQAADKMAATAKRQP